MKRYRATQARMHRDLRRFPPALQAEARFPDLYLASSPRPTELYIARVVRNVHGVRDGDTGPFREIRRDEPITLATRETRYGRTVETMAEAVSSSYREVSVGQLRIDALQRTLEPGRYVISTALRYSRWTSERVGKSPEKAR